MHVDLWDHAGGRSRVMAVIRLTDGQLKIEEKEPVPPGIREDLEALWRMKGGKGERAFLRAVTLEYSGSYTRGIFVRDN